MYCSNADSGRPVGLYFLINCLPDVDLVAVSVLAETRGNARTPDHEIYRIARASLTGVDNGVVQGVVGLILLDGSVLRFVPRAESLISFSAFSSCIAEHCGKSKQISKVLQIGRAHV